MESNKFNGPKAEEPYGELIGADYSKRIYAKPDPEATNTLHAINEILATQQWGGANYALEEELPFPVFFVFGTPRSGTTLATQLLCQCLDVAWVDNIAARFWRAPALGLAVSKSLKTQFQGQVGLESDYGKSADIFGPHEFGYFWQHWLNKNTVEDFTSVGPLASADLAGLKTCIAQMMHITKKPMIFKNIMGANHASDITHALKKVVWIQTTRDPLSNAASIYHARMTYYGRPDVWWSTMPSNYAVIKEQTPAQQIVGQILSLDDQYKAAFVGANNLVQVDYADMCTNPTAVLESIVRISMDVLGYEPRRIKDAPSLAPRQPSRNFALFDDIKALIEG